MLVSYLVKLLCTLRMNLFFPSACPRKTLGIVLVISLNSLNSLPSSMLGAFISMFIIATVAHAFSTV